MGEKAPKIIKERRRSFLWSVRRLAREAGLSAPYVSQIENGKRPLTPRATGQIADALGIPTYDLLAIAGFIPQDDLDRAKGMAYQAMRVPEMCLAARGDTDKQRTDWLIVDYLYRLGHDPYGTGWDYGPGGNHLDWTPLEPDAPEPITNRMLREAHEWRAGMSVANTSPIEGWDELSPADQTFIQQMVNKLRRPAADE